LRKGDVSATPSNLNRQRHGHGTATLDGRLRSLNCQVNTISAHAEDKLVTGVTSYVRNGFGEVIRQTSPDSGITDYVRDARGLVTETTECGVTRPAVSRRVVTRRGTTD
ncbi:MAG: hypothetical protein AB1749_17285, partial [Pseudomonadota bacterium]